MLSGINQSQKLWDSTYRRYLVVKFIRNQKQNDRCQGVGGEENREELFNGYRVPVLQDEKVLKIGYTSMSTIELDTKQRLRWEILWVFFLTTIKFIFYILFF